MIQAERETWEALHKQELAISRVQVKWRLGDQTTGIDVTERVMSVSPISRILAPYLGGFTLSTTSVVLQNDDGAFTPGRSGSHLELDAEYYYLTKMDISQGIRRADGTFEYIDVFSGWVTTLSRNPGHSIELSLIGTLHILSSTLLPEEYTIDHMNVTRIQTPVITIIRDLVSSYSRLVNADVDGQDHVEGFARHGGWSIVGTFSQGTPIGDAVSEVARNAMGSVVELEDGTLKIISEFVPATASDSEIWDGTFFPFLFTDQNTTGITFADGISSTATEVAVTYQNSTAYYEDTTLEDITGKRTQGLELPLVPHYWQAAWAARLIHEYSKYGTRGVSFTCYGVGLLLQINDRFDLRDPETDEIVRYRCVSKIWDQNGAVQVVGISSSGEDSVFNADFAIYGTTSWGSGDAL